MPQHRFSPEDERLRGEIRAFLQAELTDEPHRGERASGMFVDRPIAHLAAETQSPRLGRVHWPTQYGGTGWSPAQLFIFREECARAGARRTESRREPAGSGVVRIRDEEQKARYLPKMLTGEHYWCQGYSEPDRVRTLRACRRARARGDDYVVNGTKIWTTHAHFADHIFCLVRTSTQGRPQQGISFLLFEMNQPGVRIEPIITLAGDHEVNQVFFDNVPCRWPIASAREPGLDRREASARIRTRQRRHRRGTEDPSERTEARRDARGRRRGAVDRRAPSPQAGPRDPLPGARIHRAVHARATGFGAHPGSGASSQFKIASADLQQGIDTLQPKRPPTTACRITRISLNGFHEDRHRSGARGTRDRDVSDSRAASIYGGSHQVQRNIIAKACWASDDGEPVRLSRRRTRSVARPRRRTNSGTGPADRRRAPSPVDSQRRAVSAARVRGGPRQRHNVVATVRRMPLDVSN